MNQEMTTTGKQEVTQTGEGEATRSAVIFRPDTDIYETEDHVVLVADMPGVATGDLDVNLERRVLTIRGRLPGKVHDGYRRVHAEYGEGDYERTFTLSEEIDQEHIQALHKNGVLTLKMPKAEMAKTRKIAVNSG